MTNIDPAYLSEQKRKELEAELLNLKMVERKNIAGQLEYAKSLGDLSENAEYQDAKDEQGFIAGRIAQLESLITKSEVIRENTSKEIVNIGSTIKVLCDGNEFQYTIVGSNEANPAAGLISNESPLGRAFLGRKVGEKVKVMIPRGDMDCEILNIQ